MPQPASQVVRQQIERRVAQAAVGRTPLRDVLLSLKRSKMILRFRIHEETVVVEYTSTLLFLFETRSDA